MVNLQPETKKTWKKKKEKELNWYRESADL